MPTLSLTYDDWDAATESVPSSGTRVPASGITRDIPVNFKTLAGLLTKQTISASPVSKTEKETLGAALWLVLAAFRRRNVSAEDVRRLYDNYPGRFHDTNQTLLDSVR